MFSLHERTQRKVCRVAFVFCCAVPTLLTLCWVIYFHRPWHERDWRHSLESTLHVRVELEDVSAPRPQERSIENLRLADLRSKQPLLDVDELNIEPASSFVVQHLTVHCGQLDQLAQAAQVWLAGESFAPSHWKVERLTLLSAEGTQCQLENLRCEARVTSSGTHQCTVQANRGDKTVRLTIELSVDGKVRAAIDAQQATLPAWLLAGTVPGAGRWRNATFAGTILLQKQDSYLVGEFRGQIDSIDMQEWMGSDQLQTTANLQLDRLTWRDHRIETIQGSLEATAGQISHALLGLLKEKFLCTVALDAAQLNNKEQRQQIDKLGCQYQLNSAGLAISGMYTWGNTSKGCMIMASGKPLVSIPAMATLPVAQLVQLLSPHDPYWVPANREATNMAEKLPLPAADSQQK